MSAKRRSIKLIQRQFREVKTRLIRINGERDDAKLDLDGKLVAASEAKRAYDALVSEQKQLTKECDDLQREELETQRAVNRSPTVSDHAVVRYLERVMGADIEGIRRKIIADDGAKIKVMDDGSIDRDEYTLIINNNTVCSVLA